MLEKKDGYMAISYLPSWLEDVRRFGRESLSARLAKVTNHDYILQFGFFFINFHNP